MNWILMAKVFGIAVIVVILITTVFAWVKPWSSGVKIFLTSFVALIGAAALLALLFRTSSLTSLTIHIMMMGLLAVVTLVFLSLGIILDAMFLLLASVFTLVGFLIVAAVVKTDVKLSTQPLEEAISILRRTRRGGTRDRSVALIHRPSSRRQVSVQRFGRRSCGQRSRALAAGFSRLWPHPWRSSLPCPGSYPT